MTSPQKPLIGSYVPCPFGCQHPHIVLEGRDIVRRRNKRGVEFCFKDCNGERQSLCNSLAKDKTKHGAVRILWSMNGIVSTKEAQELYESWRNEIFRKAAEYVN